jgi:hypothetical protein
MTWSRFATSYHVSGTVSANADSVLVGDKAAISPFMALGDSNRVSISVQS